jgi:hypothetical protein
MHSVYFVNEVLTLNKVTHELRVTSIVFHCIVDTHFFGNILWSEAFVPVLCKYFLKWYHGKYLCLLVCMESKQFLYKTETKQGLW